MRIISANEYFFESAHSTGINIKKFLFKAILTLSRMGLKTVNLE